MLHATRCYVTRLGRLDFVVGRSQCPIVLLLLFLLFSLLCYNLPSQRSASVQPEPDFDFFCTLLSATDLWTGLFVANRHLFRVFFSVFRKRVGMGKFGWTRSRLLLICQKGCSRSIHSPLVTPFGDLKRASKRTLHRSFGTMSKAVNWKWTTHCEPLSDALCRESKRVCGHARANLATNNIRIIIRAIL